MSPATCSPDFGLPVLCSRTAEGGRTSDLSPSTPAPTATPAREAAASTAARVLLLGLGNDILTDDAIGLRVIRQLQPLLAEHPNLEVRETTEMGLALLDFLTGYSAVFIVDSIQTGRAAPGTVHELDAAALQQLTGRTPHFLGVSETLALGRQLGLAMPKQVKIFAVEVQDPFTLSTDMTPALESALPAIVDRIADAARRLA